MVRLRHLAAAIALTVCVAAPATASAYDVVGTPKLYAVDHPKGLGGTVAYVVFEGTSRLHKVRDARASVHGKSGRSYSWPGACVRSSFINQNADGKPIPFLDAGKTYKVTIAYRGKTVWSGRLAAHHLTEDKRPARC
jgi:hypothetical protein